MQKKGFKLHLSKKKHMSKQVFGCWSDVWCQDNEMVTCSENKKNKTYQNILNKYAQLQ